MKINEVISEAVGTGTPPPEQAWDQDTYTGHVNPKNVQMPDFSGLKRAWQGAKMLGRGAANLPGRVKGAVAGYQASQAQRIGREQVQKLVQPWVRQWNVAVGRDPAKANNPQALHDFAMQMTQGQVKQLPMPADTNPGTVQTYLTNAIRQYFDSPTPAEPSGPSTPLTRAQQIKQSRAQRAQAQTQATPAPQAAPDLSPGVTVTSPEPIMFKFQGQNVGLGPQGQWINTKTRKPLDEPMQAFFNQQHDKMLGLG